MLLSSYSSKHNIDGFKSFSKKLPRLPMYLYNIYLSNATVKFSAMGQLHFVDNKQIIYRKRL